MTTLDFDPLTRPAPQDPRSERGLIGAAMVSPDAYAAAVSAGIRASDFYFPEHEAIWEAIERLADQGKGHGPESVLDEMARSGTLRMIQPVMLTDMFGDAYPAMVPDQARIVLDRSARRRAMAVATRITQLASAPDASVDEILASALTEIESIAPAADESTWSYLDQVLELVYEAAEGAAVNGRRDGIRWGLADVDERMSPLAPGEFAVVSAFSGGGKSLVACGIALHAAVHQGKRVLVHAMEMTRLEVGQRWVASEARVELDRVINGRFSPEDQVRIDRANARMLGASLVVDEVETVTLASLRASIRKHKPELVIVDQIPTMTPSDMRVPREQQVSALAYGLKRIAKAEGVPVLACCQLNANPTRRSDRTPTMHDLRESQAITHAANTLVILSDPMEAEPETSRKGEIDWIIRKQRQGPKDIVIPMARLFHYSRIACLAGDDRD